MKTLPHPRSYYRKYTMLTTVSIAVPIKILLQTILNEYLYNSYCLTVISEKPLIDFEYHKSFMYIAVNDTENLVYQMLEASEKGCSDYIVKMKDPKVFMVAFDKVSHLGNTRRSDRKIIFIPFSETLPKNETNKIVNLLSMKESSFVTNMLIIIPSEMDDLSNCLSYDIVTHRYVGTDDINEPLFLDKWNVCTETFNKNANLFPHDLTNLYGKTVKVAAFTYKPYVLLDLNSNLNPLGRDGTEMRVVEQFCRWINCTIELVRDDEHQWGEIYKNMTGVGVIGSVVEDRADIGITALYSWYEEYVALDFSAPYIRSGVTCIAPAARILVSWELPLLPFSLSMWLCLVFTFFYASVALVIAQKGSSRNVFLRTFGMMVSQTQDELGASWRIRSITGWLLVTGLILDNAYSSGLASTFTVPKYEKSIDTIQDIVDRKLEWGATHDAWIFSIVLSTDPLIMQLVRQFKIYPAEVLKKKSFTRSMAFSIEKLPAGYFAIGEYITKEAVLDLELMTEDFYYEQCVAMMRKSSPYTEKMSEIVGKLHQSGLMLAWETQVALKYLNYKVQLEVKLSRSRKDVDTVEPLAIRHVLGILMIYAAGTTLSIIVFFIEYTRKEANEK